MPICYLCGREMIDKNSINVSCQDASAKPAYQHDEHILQNSLFSRLSSSTILCEDCGSKLGQEIDGPFSKIFDSFTVQIDHLLIRREHGGKVTKSINGHIIDEDGSKIEIAVREGKNQPLVPFYKFEPATNIARIYGNRKAAKAYQIKAKSELQKQGIDTSKVHFEIIDDMKDFTERGIYFSEGFLNFSNALKLGLSKIAVGFASHHGIARRDMPCSLDIDAQQIISSDNIVPFLPMGVVDKLIETSRMAIEPNFPSHTLVLFTQDAFEDTKLVCYIDLFSTFQFYVILNHDYKGPNVNEIYYQSITRPLELLSDLSNYDYKDLFVLICELDVPISEYGGKSTEEVRELLEGKLRNKSRAYEMDMGDTLKNLTLPIVQTFLMDRASQLRSSSNDEFEKAFEELPRLAHSDLSILREEVDRIHLMPAETFYRQNYFNRVEKQTHMRSTLVDAINLLQSDQFHLFQKYGHQKFQMLSHFVAINKL